MELEEFFEKLKRNERFEGELAQELLTPINVETKTEIDNPYLFSVLDTLSDYLSEKNLENSAYLLKSFLQYLRINKISYKRKSRKEYIQALIGIYSGKEEELSEKKSILERFLGK
jgi:hypothetical protein